MPIDNRNLRPGTKLVGRYHKQTYTCEVVAGKSRYDLEDGKVLILEGEDVPLRYRLADGREFKSLSAAGMAITGKSCNGWAFWSVETAAAPAAEVAPAPEAAATPETPPATEPPPAETEPPAAIAPAAEMPQTNEGVAGQPTEPPAPAPEPAPAVEAAPAKKRIFRLPNQKGVPEGQTRWYCHECAKSFTVATGETPETCPQGHRA